MQNELYHYGVKGMKWGIRRSKKKLGYKSTSISSAIARRQNSKVDKSFKNWKENAQKRDTAIELGKKASQAKLTYEQNRSDKSAKKAYKSAQKDYKKALSKNTTYRKGVVKQEVGRDLSRKYLSEAKKVGKQLKNDPNNKTLQKQYNRLMSQHDTERAKARRATDVAQKRSRKIASLKGTATKTVKGIAATAAVSAGLYAANKYIAKGNLNINAEQVLDYANKARKILQYF